MPNAEHKKAQDLASAAALLLRSNERAKARTLYARAAEHELLALKEIAADQIRTRGILMVSAASMLYKARLFDRAESTLFRFLSDEDVLAPARRQLRELLEVVWDERLLDRELQQEYSGVDITVSMRGGLVGFGTAPWDDFVHAGSGLRSLVIRLKEWKGGYDFRKRGPPPHEIGEAAEARVAEQIAGSYRFKIRLVEPQQRELFPNKQLIPADELGQEFFKFVENVAEGDVKPN